MANGVPLEQPLDHVVGRVADRRVREDLLPPVAVRHVQPRRQQPFELGGLLASDQVQVAGEQADRLAAAGGPGIARERGGLVQQIEDDGSIEVDALLTAS